MISVIIPTYNRKFYLQEALASVFNQKYINYEIIIVDDGSTDGTKDFVASKYYDKVRYFYEENQGESFARNFGASQAKGNYLAFLDSDDRWLDKKLYFQHQFMQQNSFLCCLCKARKIDHTGRILFRGEFSSKKNTKKILELPDVLTNGIQASGSTLIIKKDLFHQVGGFDSNVQYGEDLEFILKLLFNNIEIGYLQKSLAFIRIHNKSQSLNIIGNSILSSATDHIKIYSQIEEFSDFSKEISLLIENAKNREVFKKNLLEKSLNYSFQNTQNDYSMRITTNRTSLKYEEMEKELFKIISTLMFSGVSYEMIIKTVEKEFFFASNDENEKITTKLKIYAYYSLNSPNFDPFMRRVNYLWENVKNKFHYFLYPRYWFLFIKIIFGKYIEKIILIFFRFFSVRNKHE